MGNAAGKMLRPLILYKGKMHIGSHFRDTPDACYVGTNSSGVMDTDVLTEFLEKEFLTSTTRQDYQLPVENQKDNDRRVGGLSRRFKNLVRSAPQKKRREKDSRLDVSNGRILTESTYISTKKAAIEKSKEKAEGLRNQKGNIEEVEESATDNEDESISSQGYPCQAPPKRQRKTAKQMAAEIASDVPALQSNIESSLEVPEGYPSKTKAKRATARAQNTPAPRKKPSAPASKTKAKMLPLPKAKPRVSAVKSKAKKT
ncbi:hypothetical protein RvY_12179 [Ramazzottius varieornatus]|uniref:Uncharacterized protein n=1 Tax=Ramazzottius varieornatus TaxID=947166 RepID=A0A1D1VKM1_RAMVA|nr:hypothetical protein RvY_12179 [Ramazzottius varieornatus]